jgi:hypothetical protein
MDYRVIFKAGKYYPQHRTGLFRKTWQYLKSEGQKISYDSTDALYLYLMSLPGITKCPIWIYNEKEESIGYIMDSKKAREISEWRKAFATAVMRDKK